MNFYGNDGEWGVLLLSIIIIIIIIIIWFILYTNWDILYELFSSILELP